MKEDIEREKEKEIEEMKERVKDECTKANDILNGKIKEQLQNQWQEDAKKTMETEVMLFRKYWGTIQCYLS